MTGAPVRDRVVSDAGDALEAALDESLTGRVVLTPQRTLLLDGDAQGVLTVEDGAPIAAHHTGTGRDGSDAVADLADAAPFRAELFAAPAAPADPRGAPVEPGLPAAVLADDPTLADRTREAAPADAPSDAAGLDAVEAFLADEENVAAIQERAREEAERRAAEWGLQDVGSDA